jgi:hypothetical protein
MSDLKQLLAALAPGERFGVAADILREVFPASDVRVTAEEMETHITDALEGCPGPALPEKKTTQEQLEDFCQEHGLRFWEMVDTNRFVFERPLKEDPHATA